MERATPHFSEHCSQGGSRAPPLSMFDKNKFMYFYKGTPIEQDASRCFDLIQTALMTYGIYSEMTMVGAMATVRVETAKTFRSIEEFASGDQYEGRKDLGNDVPGDGKRYKGRGFIQITGRFNYEKYTHRLGVDLVSNPLVALNPSVAAKILALYFRDTGCHTACNNRNWTKVRKLVNGGTNGIDVFLSVVNQYLN